MPSPLLRRRGRHGFPCRPLTFISHGYEHRRSRTNLRYGKTEHHEIPPHLTRISRQHQASGTSPSPRHSQLSPTPHQRDMSVTTRRSPPVNTQFSETFPSPSIPRLPLSSPEQDVPVTNPHSPLADALSNERNPSPTPHAPLTDAAPERHVRHQPARVSHQSRDIERSLTPSDKKGRAGRSHG